jgi:PAS domain S-box-containing protein
VSVGSLNRYGAGDHSPLPTAPVGNLPARSRILIGGIIVIGVLVILAMWTVVITSIHTARDTAITHTRSEARNLAAAFANEVARNLDGIAASMEIVAQRMRANPGHYDIHAWAHEIPMLKGATIQSTIIGPDGFMIGTTLDPAAAPVDLRDREHFRVHRDGRYHGLFISKPVVGQVSKKVTIQITRRVDGANGQFLGVVDVSLSPSDLTDLTKAIDLGPRGVITLSGFDGIIRARFTRDHANGLSGIGRSIFGSSPPSMPQQNSENFVIGRSVVDQVLRLYDNRRVAGYPLTVSIGLDLSEALTASRADAVMIIVITILATLLLISLFVYLIGEIRRRAAHANVLAVQQRQLEEVNRTLEADIAFREQVEYELRETGEILDDAVDSISEAVAIWDRDDRLVMYNEPYHRPYAEHGETLKVGQRFEDILRVGAYRGIYADAVGREEEWVAERLATHRDLSGTVEQPLSDGRVVLITERRMRNGGTASLRIDITKLKQSEAQLRRMMDDLDRVQHIAGIGSLEVNLSTGDITWSASACTLFGIDPASVEPTPQFIRKFIHPDDRDKVAEAANQSLVTAIAPPPLEYRIIRTDGMERIVYRENAVQHDSIGTPVRRIITYKDITELKATEAQLRASQQHLARAQRVAATGSFELDLETCAILWSDETYRIFGLTPAIGPLNQQILEELLIPEDRPRVRAQIEAIVEGRPVPELEYRIRRPDGRIRTLHREIELVCEDDGRRCKLVGVVKDITELREAERRRDELERQLLHSQKLEALGTLAGGIAHDLNNTLVPVLALSQMLMDSVAEEDREDLQTIILATRRAKELVQQILAFSRKQEIRKAEVDPAGVVRQALQMMRATLPPNITVIEEIDQVPLTLADAGQLQQVVVNLLTNAAQAIGSATASVTVVVSAFAATSSAERRENFIRICIADTGSGMEKEVLDHIFEPFFTTKEVGEGTGLGLSVVHGIITGHGGTIDVTSEPGRGTTFTILLPASQSAAASLEAVAA